jgi:hypothetical protein
MKLLTFPITNPCSNCHRQCGDDELSECVRCGARYCSCSWECQCDRDAVEIVSRAVEILNRAGVTTCE